MVQPSSVKQAIALEHGEIPAGLLDYRVDFLVLEFDVRSTAAQSELCTGWKGMVPSTVVVIQ